MINQFPALRQKFKAGRFHRGAGLYQKAIEQDEVDDVALNIPGVKIQTLHTDYISGATTVLGTVSTLAIHGDRIAFSVGFCLLRRGSTAGPRR